MPVRRCVCGGTILKSVADLYRTEAHQLRILALRLVRSGAQAEDLVQHAFANLLSTGRDAALTPQYLRAAVRNLALNHLRDHARRRETPLDAAIANTLVSPQPTAEIVLLYRQELMRLLRAILDLPPRRREAFVLARIRALPLAEVASRMGISRNTAISHVVAACVELEQRLQ